MKHSTNTPYLIFIVVVIPLALFFFTSSIWAGLIPSSNAASENYNVTVTINNNYIKVAEAYYNITTKELRFTYYTKPTSTTVPAESKPRIYSVSTSSNLDVFCSSSIVEQKDSRHVVSCEDIEECSYIRIFFQSKYPDTAKVVEKVDEFGIITEVVEEQIYDTVYSMHIIAWSDITIISDLQEITAPQVVTSDPFNDYTHPPVTTNNSNTPDLPIITEQPDTLTVTTPPNITDTPTTTTAPAAATAPTTATAAPTTTAPAATTAPPNTTTAPTATVTTTSSAATTEQPVIPVVNVVAVAIETSAADNNVILSVGGTSSVYARISPSSATNKNVYWSSNRSDIASVSSSGTVTAYSPGIAIITCTTVDGGLTASCMVTVR